MSLSRRRLLAGMAAGLLMPKAFFVQSAFAEAAERDGLSFEHGVVVIHGRHGLHELDVELAETFVQRARGLMDRDTLAADAGMLFLYDESQPAASGFWMYRTRIPLDIAFIDTDSRIAAIHTMQPCTSPSPAGCPAYVAGVVYHAALEVNAGYFAEHGIAVGDRVSLPDLP